MDVGIIYVPLLKINYFYISENGCKLLLSTPFAYTTQKILKSCGSQGRKDPRGSMGNTHSTFLKDHLVAVGQIHTTLFK